MSVLRPTRLCPGRNSASETRFVWETKTEFSDAGQLTGDNARQRSYLSRTGWRRSSRRSEWKRRRDEHEGRGHTRALQGGDAHPPLTAPPGAIEFYKQAFGAVETMRMDGPGGRIMHAEVTIGAAPIMLSDEWPEMGFRGPEKRRPAGAASIST